MSSYRFSNSPTHYSRGIGSVKEEKIMNGTMAPRLLTKCPEEGGHARASQ